VPSRKVYQVLFSGKDRGPGGVKSVEVGLVASGSP
jgi:hypothetical protein